jgi:hypothetical protein
MISRKLLSTYGWRVGNQPGNQASTAGTIQPPIRYRIKSHLKQWDIISKAVSIVPSQAGNDKNEQAAIYDNTMESQDI